MRRALLIALGALVMPAAVQAQVEIGVDGGLSVQSISGGSDNPISFSIPTADIRLGFAGGESLVIETMLGAKYVKVGDYKSSSLELIPGVNFLVNDQLYVRAEAGLMYYKADAGAGSSSSATQFLFGGGVGSRKMLGEGALLRLEAGVDRALANTSDGIPASWNFRALVGISAVVGG